MCCLYLSKLYNNLKFQFSCSQVAVVVNCNWVKHELFSNTRSECHTYHSECRGTRQYSGQTDTQTHSGTVGTAAVTRGRINWAPVCAVNCTRHTFFSNRGAVSWSKLHRPTVQLCTLHWLCTVCMYAGRYLRTSPLNIHSILCVRLLRSPLEHYTAGARCVFKSTNMQPSM